MTNSKTETRIDSARGSPVEREGGGVGESLPDTVSEEQRKQIDDAFDLFDVDKGGTIDARELKVRRIRYWLGVGGWTAS